MRITESKYLENLINEMLLEDDPEEGNDEKEEKKEDASSSDDNSSKNKEDNDEEDSEEDSEEDEFELESGYVFGFITQKNKDSWAYILKKTGKLPEDKEQLKNFVKTMKEDFNLSEYRICSLNLVNKTDGKKYMMFFEPSSKKWMSDNKKITEDEFKKVFESKYWKETLIPKVVEKLELSCDMLEKYIKPFITDGLISVDELKFEKVEKTVIAPAILAGIKSTSFRV